MVGGRLLCLSCLFTYGAVLLSGVCLQDVEASTCPDSPIHREVGDTVELPSCLKTENLTEATWKYDNEILLADMDRGVTNDPLFKRRIVFNTTTFNLTVRQLTRQDSGSFTFVSATNGGQRPTVDIKLQVHERLTQPVLNVSSTWHPSNGSCTVVLQCTTTSDTVTYRWSTGSWNQTGSLQLYSIRPEDGETEFICTISNTVREKSASEKVTCSNDTSAPPHAEQKPFNLFLSLGAAGGGLMLIIIVSIICCHKHKQGGSDSHDITLYADIAEVAVEDVNSHSQRTLTTLESNSLYETIDNRIHSGPPGPETVYDQIRLDRMKKATLLR